MQGRYKVEDPTNRNLSAYRPICARGFLLKGEAIVNTATIHAERTGRKKTWRMPSEIIGLYLLILLVLFAVALMLAWGASMMNP
jgi:hypothetical protein